MKYIVEPELQLVLVVIGLPEGYVGLDPAFIRSKWIHLKPKKSLSIVRGILSLLKKLAAFLTKLELQGVSAIQSVTCHSIVSETLTIKHNVVDVETYQDQVP